MATQKTSYQVASYTLGFGLSLGLTYLAYAAATNHIWNGWALMIGLIALAIMQLTVQLLFFLHFGRGTDKHWNSSAFWFAILTIVIVAIGSLWIMHNMNYNMMSPEMMDDYMMEQKDKGF